MKRQDVIEFLRSKTGYLKKGNQWVADKLGIDLNLATECKKEVAASEYKKYKENTQEFTNENINEINDKGFNMHYQRSV
jgi:hypothetical protein